MNEEQREKVKMICRLWEDHEDCCGTISSLKVINSRVGSIVISQPFHNMTTANIDFDTKRALLTGAINELNHLKETIEVKLSNELGELCKQQ